MRSLPVRRISAVAVIFNRHGKDGQPPVLPPVAEKEPEWHAAELERFPDTGTMRALRADGQVQP